MPSPVVNSADAAAVVEHCGSSAFAGAVVVRNFASLLAGRFISQLIGFVSNAYLARRISPGGFGAVAVAQAVMTYLAIFSDSGLSVIAVREASQRPGKLQELISSISALRLLMAVVCATAGLACADFLPYSQSSRGMLRIFALSLPFQAIAVDWAFRALQRMHYSAILDVAGSAGTLLLTIALIRDPGHGILVPVIALVVASVRALLSVWVLRGIGFRLTLDFRPRLFYTYLSQSLPLCASSLAITFYIQANYLILGKVHGEGAVGFYAAAAKLTAPLSGLQGLYYAAMAPTLMVLYVESKRKAAVFLAQSVRLTAILGVGMCAIGFPASRMLVTAAFGPAFEEAVPVFALMLGSAALVAIGHNWAQLLIAAQGERLLLGSTAVGGLANLAVCAALVQRFGPVGAAIGNLSAELLVHVALVLFCKRLGVGGVRAAAGPAVSGACGLVAALLVSPLGLTASLLVSIVAYGSMLFATRSVIWTDICALGKAIRIRKLQVPVLYG